MPDLGGQHRESIIVFVVGTVVGALVLGLVWLGFALTRSDGSSADPVAPLAGTPVSTVSAPETKTPSPQQVADAHIKSCSAVYTLQTAPLQAADASMAQWEVHVGAMNKLVTGAVTQRQANQFWNSTRVGAWTKLHRFTRTQQRYDQRTHRCPQQWTASANPAIQTCRTAVATRNHTLKLAAVALHTWRSHVVEMDMLKAGRMTAQQAQDMWLKSWVEGNHQVHAYTREAATAERLTC